MWNQNQNFFLLVALSVNMVLCVEQDLTCFSSTDPAAPGLKKIFDFHNDEDNLWEESSRPVCSVTIPTSFSHCCPDIQRSISTEVVYVFCHNLTGAELLKMEGSEGPVPFNKTDCPGPAGPPGPPTPPAAEDKTGHLGPTGITVIVIVTFVVVIIITIIIIIVFVVYKARSSSSSNRATVLRGDQERMGQAWCSLRPGPGPELDSDVETGSVSF